MGSFFRLRLFGSVKEEDMRGRFRAVGGGRGIGKYQATGGESKKYVKKEREREKRLEKHSFLVTAYYAVFGFVCSSAICKFSVICDQQLFYDLINLMSR